MELFSYQQNPTPYGTIRHPTYRDPLNSYLNAEIFRMCIFDVLSTTLGTERSSIDKKGRKYPLGINYSHGHYR